MADLTPTASQVQSIETDDREIITSYSANVAIEAGKSVALVSDEWVLAQNTADDTAAARGITINAAEAGQPLHVQSAGRIDMGAAANVQQGEPYGVSANAGGIAPLQDLVATNRLTFLCYGTDTANEIELMVNATGVQHA